MFTSMTDSALQDQRSKIVIDWSDLFTGDRLGGGHEVDRMLQWVHTYPRRSDIHVYLRSPKRTTAGRKLQNALQALGCTVTVTRQDTAREQMAPPQSPRIGSRVIAESAARFLHDFQLQM